jgi:hypothetical protein
MNNINIGGLKQSASIARIENAISQSDFFFVCDMERKSKVKESEKKRLSSIAQKVNAWYFA